MTNYNLLSGKNSQVTLFIVISVVVMVVFSVFLILISNSTSRKSESDFSLAAGSSDYNKQFSSYMNSCLKDALEEGLYILGKQGGFIFKGQEGSIIDFEIKSRPYSTASDSANYNVTYITDPGGLDYMYRNMLYPCINENTSLAKMFPELVGKDCMKHYSHDMENINYLIFSTFQSIDNHAKNLNIPLCSENQSFNMNGEKIKICSSPKNKYKGNYSIEAQLEAFIENKMNSCFDDSMSYIKDQIEADISSNGDIDVSVLFADDYTSAKVSFPVKFSLKKTDSEFQIDDFYARADVRFKSIYSILYGNGIMLYDSLNDVFTYNKDGLIDHDFNNLTFDIERESYRFINRYNLSDISLRRIYDKSGSMIVVEDSGSRIDGKPYVYNVAMHNRKPALDHVHSNPRGDYDIYAYVGDTLVIAPLAYDPDEEGKAFGNKVSGLEYSYKIIDKSWSWREQDLMNNSLYLDGEDETGRCVHPDYGITSGRCTSLKLNKSDLGKHYIKVKVTDHNGLDDFQIVSVFVDMDPEIIFDIGTIYDLDLYNGLNIVSRRDPLIINISESNFSEDVSTDYILWKDKEVSKSRINLIPDGIEETFSRNYPAKIELDNEIVVYPSYENNSPYSFYVDFVKEADRINNFINTGFSTNDKIIGHINSMKVYHDVFDPLIRQGYPLDIYSSEESSVDLSYYSQGVIEQSRSKGIMIAECIPYRSDVPAYPFSLINSGDYKLEMNHFLVNHTCCSGDINGNPSEWEYLYGSDCYDVEEYGTYNDFVDSSITAITPELLDALGQDDYDDDILDDVPLSNDYEKDLYIRKLKGKCESYSSRNLGPNTCSLSNYEILKLSYCSTRNGKFGYAVSETTPLLEDGYYKGVGWLDKCMCYNSSSNKPVVLNPMDDGMDETYCCPDTYGTPARISDMPCELDDCSEYPVKIGESFVRYGDLCMCGDMEIDINSEKSDWYCCNPFESGDAGYIVSEDGSDCQESQSQDIYED